MKTFGRYLSLSLVIFAVLSSLSLYACDKIADKPPAPPIAENTSVNLKLIAKDENFAAPLVRNDSWPVNSEGITYAREILEKIHDVSGIRPAIKTDWKKKSEPYDSEHVEILFGNTAYPETAKVLKTISYGEYKIRVSGNKLVVAAFDMKSLSLACEALKEYIDANYKNDELVIPGDLMLYGVTDARLNSVPLLEDGVFECTYECGNNGLMIYCVNTSENAYDRYFDKLTASGWNKYDVNNIRGNIFGTFTNDKYTLTAGFYAYEKAARIIVEPLAEPVPKEKENVYAEVTTPKITMLGLEFTSGGEVNANGLSILIRLADGRFVIVDGGFGYEKCSNLLVDTIKEQSADYVARGQKPKIAAWIITHAHGDHCGALRYNLLTKFRNIEKENFLVNFMSDKERLKAMNSDAYKDYWERDEGSAWKDVMRAVRSTKAKIRHVHTGQVFYFADLKMETLYTIEDYAPRVCNALNTTSVVFKMTFKSGDTLMITGDATGDAVEIMSKMYGDYLKCDILQVCHHGYSTKNNDHGMIKGYALMSPKVLLWPQGTGDYDSYKEKPYNKVLFSKEEGGENDNFKECFVAGMLGDKIELDIPYKIGTADVYRKR